MKFNVDTLQHIYQRTKLGRLIFYRAEDYILYFTIFSVYARRYDIRVAKLCLMINHVHSLISARNKQSLTSFIDIVTSLFVREYNQDINRVGTLFEKQFGRASKEGGKAIRNCSIYIDNNPVEKKLCQKPEDYKWNFLAYASSDFPYSQKIVLRKASYHLQKSIALLQICIRNRQYLNYSLQRQLFSNLTVKEKDQLTDYIIHSYNVIDYGYVEKYFGSVNQYLTAVHSTTGTEYDIEENWDKYSYKPFNNMIDIVNEMGYCGSNRQFHNMSEHDLSVIANTIYQKTKYGEALIAMFLHLDINHISYLLNLR